MSHAWINAMFSTTSQAGPRPIVVGVGAGTTNARDLLGGGTAISERRRIKWWSAAAAAPS